MKNKKLITLSIILLACAALVFVFVMRSHSSALDYSDAKNWAYYGGEADTDADVFFIAPTSVKGDKDHFIADINDAEQKGRILSAIGMQSGIYNVNARFFSPYYRMITLSAYGMDEKVVSPYMETAYNDVKAAFDYYMKHENNGRPVIIASFSQGAEHGLRLLKEYLNDSSFSSQFVAAYLIGWRVTDADLKEQPKLKMAQGETDTGVIIAFDCEAEYIDDTIIVPKGTFTYSINPLNWKTDSTPASKEENLGYVYPAGDGSVKEEIPNFCGAVIDSVRGTLKVPDVSSADYPAHLSIFPDGSFHIYDYEFFYRNLQQNVLVRTDAFLSIQTN